MIRYKYTKHKKYEVIPETRIIFEPKEQDDINKFESLIESGHDILIHTAYDKTKNLVYQK